MPERKTVRRARKDARKGKAPTTQAGNFVREEIEHIREGLHGAANVKQAIAIGLSKARKAGVPLPARGKSARKAKSPGIGRKRESSAKRSRVTQKVLKRMPRSAASSQALGQHSRAVAKKRGAASRRGAAAQGARTKGRVGRQQAARKAARTRLARGSQARRRRAS